MLSRWAYITYSDVPQARHSLCFLPQTAWCLWLVLCSEALHLPFLNLGSSVEMNPFCKDKLLTFNNKQ